MGHWLRSSKVFARILADIPFILMTYRDNAKHWIQSINFSKTGLILFLLTIRQVNEKLKVRTNLKDFNFRNTHEFSRLFYFTNSVAFATGSHVGLPTSRRSTFYTRTSIHTWSKIYVLGLWGQNSHEIFVNCIFLPSTMNCLKKFLREQN